MNKSIIVSVVAFFLVEFSFAQSLSRVPLELEAGKYFCSGDFASAQKEIESIQQTSSSYVIAQISSTAIPNVLETSLRRLEEVKNIRQLSELDRLIMATAVMRSGKSGFVKAEDLLEFSSNDPIIEAYRKTLLVSLEPFSNINNNMKMLMEAYYQLPYLDSGILIEIFTLGLAYKPSETLLAQFFDDIDELPENSEDKLILMAFREYVPPYKADQAKAHAYVKKAFEQCRHDQQLALYYIYDLLDQGKNSEAEILIEEQIRIQSYPTACFSFLMGELQLKKNSKEEALKYFYAAKESELTLNKKDRKELRKYIDQLEGKVWRRTLLILTSMLIAALLSYLYYRRRTRTSLD